MNREAVIELARSLLTQAHVLHEAFPDVDAMRVVEIANLGLDDFEADQTLAAVRASLRYLRDEMVLIQQGGASNLVVLEGETLCVERQLEDLLTRHGAAMVENR